MVLFVLFCFFNFKNSNQTKIILLKWNGAKRRRELVLPSQHYELALISLHGSQHGSGGAAWAAPKGPFSSRGCAGGSQPHQGQGNPRQLPVSPGLCREPGQLLLWHRKGLGQCEQIFDLSRTNPQDQELAESAARQGPWAQGWAHPQHPDV